MKKRIVFAGTPEFALPALRVLCKSEVDLVAVYTQPDRPSGRGRKLTASPIKQFAQSHNIPVYQPESFKKKEELDRLRDLQAHMMLVIAYGLILPQAVLDMPVIGCVNLHASLLPRWRGAAPIQRAIEAGDTVTGVTMMQMEVGLDSGDMLASVEIAIEADDTGGSLHDKLAQLAGVLLMENLDELLRGKLKPTAQDDTKACYAHKLHKQEAGLDWRKDAKSLARKVCALNPWPIATAELDDQVLRIHKAHAIDGSTENNPGEIIRVDNDGIVVAAAENLLVIDYLQKRGGRVMTAAEFINGACLHVGQHFKCSMNGTTQEI